MDAHMPVMSSTAVPQQRKRGFKRRSATGCKTCRIRRVKCDEGEPSCSQCLRGRRICDGYPAKRPHRRHGAGQNSIFLLPPLMSPSLFNIEQEDRCFHFFRQRTVPRLSGSFESPFWNQLLLRATHHEPAVRRAAVALGALHEHLEPGKVKLDEKDGSFALQQYHQAIKLVTATMREKGRLAADVALMTCALLVCFEILRGYPSAALLHIDGGVKIIHELQSCQSSGSLSLSSVPYVPLRILSQVFTRLDTQASGIVHGRPRHLLCANQSTEDSGYDADIPSSFDSLESARNSLDYIRTRAISALQSMPNTYTSGSKSGPKIPVEARNKLSLDLIRSFSTIRLKQWSSALESLLQERHGLKSPHNSERRAIAILKVHRVMTGLNFSIDFARAMSDEMIWDEHLHDFEIMISHVEQVISLEEGVESNFTLDSEVIEPLSFAAVKCRDGRLRRKAIGILRQQRRGEGIWNSFAAAEVAERLVNIEEEGLGHGLIVAEQVPRWKRVCGVQLGLDAEHRRATLTYVKLRADWGKDTIFEQIEWVDPMRTRLRNGYPFMGF